MSVVLKRFLILMLTLITACSAALAEAAEEVSPADQLLLDVNGTYDELFTVICAPDYDQLWLDDCAALVGEENAEAAAKAVDKKK